MIPDEAVEAAVNAVYGDGVLDAWVKPDEISAAMRAALEAAAPHMAAQVLLEAVDAFPLETITAPDNAVMWLRRRAEQIR